jgi:hypothetical protein
MYLTVSKILWKNLLLDLKRQPSVEVYLHFNVYAGVGVGISEARKPQAPAYLEPNSGSLQKPLEGLSVLALSTSKNRR